MSAEDDREEGLLSHLLELRTRLLKAVIAVVVVLVALLPFAQRLYTWLAQPLVSKLPAGSQLVAIEVASPFFAPIKLAFFVAIVLAMPLVLYQLWAFVAPGLYRHERRLATPLLVSAMLLFYGGVAFAYFLVLPTVFGFLTAVTPADVAMMTDISRYLDFVMVLFLAFGASFEVPVAVVILAALGVVDIPQLKAARGYVVVGAFVVAAVLTPPDVVSQLLLAIPMCLLYEAGIIAARFVRPRSVDADAAAS
ncbi:twin-arginine translocase subunit TatC [Coralloluteibacterium stylophorae]|uniref:Sec-independent protein translocase protein TatC n=1 Tax=Coralloluteibacterium stylophorae TaxID=1776034 RepID=A0A8J7VU68_9GAMM|nr:twin-arginine translocase subunit TatC [Coralloluteibacterium stylophorae]MBS7457119.1 twin-arginine translocase subunit TatC [Coralloluteibacterium stylophorae]